MIGILRPHSASRAWLLRTLADVQRQHPDQYVIIVTEEEARGRRFETIYAYGDDVEIPVLHNLLVCCANLVHLHTWHRDEYKGIYFNSPAKRYTNATLVEGTLDMVRPV